MDYQTQMELEDQFDKHQLIPRLREEYNILEIRDLCEANDIPIEFGIDLLVHMMILKRANVSTLVGILNHFCNTKQECADLLYKAAVIDLVDWEDYNEIFVVKIQVNNNIMSQLQKFQFPLPMVVQPEELRNNRHTGYTTEVSRKGSLILKNNHHDDDICLDHLNRMNQIKLSLNPSVAHFVNNKWKNIDRCKEGETVAEYQARRRAFDKYTASTKDIVDAFIVMGNEFYLTHKYDKRGRTYCVGYHINPQGNDWNKAVIQFGNGEVTL